MMWARKESIKEKPGEFCLGCHFPEGMAEKVIPQNYFHPMDISASSMIFFRSQKNINCSTCHDFHNPYPLYDDPEKEGEKQTGFLRYAKNDASEICVTCHDRYVLIKGTDHDLTITAPDFINTAGQSPQQGGVCSPCHIAHKAPIQKYLWSAPIGPALLKGWEASYTTDNNTMTMLCTGCHSPGEIAEKHIPQYGLHPKEKVMGGGSSIPFGQVKKEFPLFTDTGEVTENGNIVCSTCHNPHQWDPHVEAKGPGQETEGNVTNSFLRTNLLKNFCSECHADDVLFKYKYFHSHIGRKKEKEPFVFK
jgi:hypothetical protein